MNKEEMQLIWDKTLIDCWRKDYKLSAAVYGFRDQTGIDFFDCDLLRTPPKGTPWGLSTRVFVAQRLEKISNRLWDQPVERDEALINKLQTSKYTTSTTHTNVDNELRVTQNEYRKNKARIRVFAKKIGNRNNKTDWTTVK